MATTNECFYVVTASGAQRWDLVKRDLELDSAINAAFGATVTRSIPAVVNISGNYGKAGVCIGNGFQMWSVRVKKLALTAPYTINEGVHTPVFNSPDLPLLPMLWEPPGNMAVVLAMLVHNDTSHRHYLGEHYLVAFDGQKRMWRMPLSNLYANCKLCHGQDAKYTVTALESVQFGCDMFDKSRWNADLFEPSMLAQTSALFRFKPEGKGFTQLNPEVPSGKDWTSLCQKIADEKLNQMILLPQ